MKGAIKEIWTKADKVRFGYGMAFIMLFASLILTTVNIRRFMQEVKTVDETNEVLISLGIVSNSLKDAETSLRGYFIMKDKIFLSPYKDSRPKFDLAMNMLNQHVASGTVKGETLDLLGKVAAEEYDILAITLEEFSSNQDVVTNSLKYDLGHEKLMMDSIRHVISSMQDYARSVLASKSQAMANTSSAIQTINIASLIVSLILAFYSFTTFNSENRAREKSDKKTIEYRGRLEERIIELRKVNAEMITLKSNEKFASTGRIARTIAHEVRNPLTNINLAIDQLKDEAPAANEDSHGLLDMVSRNSARINQLVTELLNATRFSELHFENKSVNQLLDEAIEMASDRIALKQITVEKEYAANLCDANVDAEKIKIAFLNIIVNAVEAMEAGKGILKLKTETEGEGCKISISDNGYGINEEGMQRLFEPYFTSKKKGGGLGMTNTQNIILNHKGRIYVDSTPGQGATFVITLNCAS